MAQSTVRIEISTPGTRLDRLLADCADGLSRSRVQSLIREGQATVDEQVVVDPGLRVKTGQVVTLAVPEAKPAEPAPEGIPLDIAYEDDHLIVLNKPAGLVVHPGAGRDDGTLVNALIAHCGETLSGIGGVRRPGIVHRLDRLTSGLMVVAKTDLAHRSLSDQFAAHGCDGRLVRRYVGFAWGKMLRPHLTIDAPIGRSHTSRRKMAVVKEPVGRRAVTHITRSAHFVQNDMELMEFVAELETGRTHQIRVHMASVGHPLLGDPVYGKGYATRESRLNEAARAALTALNRQALHAEALGFEHPVTGEQLKFEAELPDDLLCLRRALTGQGS